MFCINELDKLLVELISLLIKIVTFNELKPMVGSFHYEESNKVNEPNYWLFIMLVTYELFVLPL